MSPNLRVADKVRSRIGFPVDQNRIEQLYRARFAEIRVTFDTDSQPELVKLFSYYDIDVRFVADINYRINIDKLE